MSDENKVYGFQNVSEIQYTKEGMNLNISFNYIKQLSYLRHAKFLN